jgi:serine/threonine protein phosphatase 1
MTNIWALGDLHGNYLGLKQVLDRSNFDYENDLLITMGDIVDGNSGVYQCVEELLKIKKRIDIVGNHDDVFNTWLTTGVHYFDWKQGGFSTAKSYADATALEKLVKISSPGTYEVMLNPGDIPDTHKDFFRHQIRSLTLERPEGTLFFVHGGFDLRFPPEDQDVSVLMWDRVLWEQATASKGYLEFKGGIDKVFIGHTHTYSWRNPLGKPLYRNGVWNIDTGAGGFGRLTLFNVITEQYIQSDIDTYGKNENR